MCIFDRYEYEKIANHNCFKSDQVCDQIIAAVTPLKDRRMEVEDLLVELVTTSKIEAYRAVCGCPECQTALAV